VQREEEPGEYAERVSDAPARPQEQDALRAAIDAAEIGTWSWDIDSGRVAWTPRTYQVFGYEPGALEASYELFLQQVHAGDRPAVKEWISRALVERGRTALEFRIHRPDGTVRWVRSTGRAILDGRGEVVRMAGVVEDVTEERQRSSGRSLAAPKAAGDGSFSVRQLGQILGVGEATVKRLADAGRTQFLRSSRKDSHRFTPEQVLEYLRATTAGSIDFDSAAQAQDMSACLVYLIEQLIAGKGLEALLDEPVKRAARMAPPAFVRELLGRMPFLVPERRRQVFPALLALAGEPEPLEPERVSCVLRAHGLEVLRPAGAPQPEQLAELVGRIRARVAVILIGRGSRGVQASGLAAAAATAAAGTATVCVRCENGGHAPPGVTRFRSMSQLGAIVRGCSS